MLIPLLLPDSACRPCAWCTALAFVPPVIMIAAAQVPAAPYIYTHIHKHTYVRHTNTDTHTQTHIYTDIHNKCVCVCVLIFDYTV